MAGIHEFKEVFLYLFTDNFVIDFQKYEYSPAKWLYGFFGKPL